ncbi:hypothetical protein FZC35_02735 [Candidatus Cytomitobacter indipagum]|uniref:Glycerol-3-phosphate dehydrogenase NAD-dependent C-terminal domain-containing protein n=1 Tax=Candidatus Cytomitobacter indipagum TaxID=2601575 RepID=A0A5C0UGV8_9PROT|nr:NAD(P)H-dependent glycerol-3-phosphate dehydrogenase [Candidatus Cytomitobacter indipagum]QEK38264.1 hypothetical protein FZC35_02735 [Candidatus Cytomitobacter indipagum]
MFKIIGSGSFGTALRHVIKNSGFVISDIDYEFVIPAVPSYAVPDVLDEKEKTIIFVSKGFLENGKLIGEWADKIGLKWAVFAGPHFASELVQNLETCSVLGADSEIPEVMKWKNMNVKFSHHKIEIQLLGALKNIYACFFGIIDGLKLGKNFSASMFSLVIEEINEIFNKLNLESNMIYNQACIGDLILTCTSSQSRNYNEGFNRVMNIKNHQLSEAKHSAIAFIKRFPDQKYICSFVGEVMHNDLKGSDVKSLFDKFYKDYKELKN